MEIKDYFNDIVGYESVKQELYKIVHTLINKDKYKEVGVNTPHGLLLSGSPGVGKTSMANDLIKASGRKCYICRKDKSNGAFTKYIKSIFTRAKNNPPCIILLDDLDKFANDDYDHRDSEEFVTVQACIDDCKDHDVFVLATVNDEEKLPYSLVRAGRFDTKIYVENPTADDAENIVKHYLSNKKVGDLDYKVVARLLNGASCAELEAVVNEAGIFAVYKNKECVDMDDITRACLRVIYDAPESSIVTEPQKRRYIAIHEVGHAVVADYLNPESVNFISVRQHNSSIGGFTDIFDEGEENKLTTVQEEVKNICVDMAGVEAVNLFLKEYDCGGSSDVVMATELSASIVQVCAAYGIKFVRGSAYRNKDIPSTEKSMNRSRNKIIKIIEEQQKLARKILKKNRVFAMALVDYLMKDDTMTREKFLEIKSKYISEKH